MTATVTPLPGDVVIADLPAEDYHAHPALSSTRARTILKAPALYAWELEHPRPPSEAMEFGTAVHSLVLGHGPQVRAIDALTLRGKDAAAEAEKARAEGLVPLALPQHETALSVRDAVKRHPLASALLSGGAAEQSAFWTDPLTGVRCRARFDYMTEHEGRLTLVDLKTARSADPKKFGRHAMDFGYHIQQAWYLDAADAIDDRDARFLFVVAEKTPPYLVSVVELDEFAADLGRQKAHEARVTYAQCVESGVWPGYPEDIHSVSLPAWAYDDEDEEITI